MCMLVDHSETGSDFDGNNYSMSAEPVVSKYTQALPGNLTSTWTVMGKATRRGHPALWLIQRRGQNSDSAEDSDAWTAIARTVASGYDFC